MLHFIPGFIKAPIAALLFVLNTIIWCSVLYPVAIVGWLPVDALQKKSSKLMIRVAELWITCNSVLISLLHRMQWQIQLPENLSGDRSYLVISNHQSWVDIVVLQHVFNHKIPFIRFFLKDQLRYVPFLGVAWKALDFPFMKRYSRSYLDAYPDKRGEDLEATKRACDKLVGKPVSILNFLEGTRFTAVKHAKLKSVYKMLLPPKTGGIAYVIEAMGRQFDSILDVTLFYPGGVESLWGLFSGRIDAVTVLVQQRPIPPEILAGNYFEDETFKRQMQSWITDLWQQKDAALLQMAGRQ